MPGPILGRTTTPVTPPGAPDLDATWSVLTSAGDVIVSSDRNDAYLQPGGTGWFAPPYVLDILATPGRAGGINNGPRTDVRIGDLDVIVRADTHIELRDAVRLLIARLYPGNEVTVQVQQRDGSGRYLKALCDAGLQGDLGRDTYGQWFQKFIPVFKIVEPYWVDLTPVTMSWPNTTPVDFFPLGPVVLSSSSILGVVPILNIGDAPESYPIWTVTGPFTGFTLTNQTTGKAFTVAHTAADNTKAVIVDTQAKTVVDQDGANLFGSLDQPPQLWPLVPGTNVVNLDVEGSDADSRISVDFFAEYLSP